MTFKKWWATHKPVADPHFLADYDRLLIAKSWAREAWDECQVEIEALKKENADMMEALTIMVSVVDDYAKGMDNWEGSAKEFVIEKYVKLPKKGGSKRATKALKKMRNKS